MTVNRRRGGFVAVAILMVVLLVALWRSGGDEGDPAAGVSDAAPTGPVAVTAATGESFTATYHLPPSDADRVLVAAPSRNADEASLAPLIDEIRGRDCGAVVTFDARLLDDTSPLDAYRAVLDHVSTSLRLAGPDLSVLGASFTGLPALQAAEGIGAGSAFVLSPSDESPNPPPDDVMVRLIGASDDGGFVTIYEQWRALGFEAVEVDSAAHGTAMFADGASAEVVGLIADRFCS